MSTLTLPEALYTCIPMTTRRMQRICGASATRRRGKAGYVCVLPGDECTLAQLVDDIHVWHVNRVGIDLASMRSLHSPDYVVFPVTERLSFLTLYSPSTVSSGDEYYAGPVSTGTSSFEFGDDYIYSVYVSKTVHCIMCSVVFTFADKNHIHVPVYYILLQTIYIFA